MTLAEERIDRTLRNGAGAALIGIPALFGLFIACDVATPYPWSGNHGVVFPSPAIWNLGGVADYVMLALQVVVAGVLLLGNHLYQLTRSASLTFASLFVAMEAMLPSVATTFQGGPFVALAMIVAVLLLLHAYKRPKRTVDVFLAFFIVSGASFFQVALLGLLPALLIGLMQMRIFRLKPLLAAIIGTVAPWWILWCIGFMEHPHPSWEFSLSFLAGLPRIQLIHLLIGMGLTIAAGIGFTVMNLPRLIGSNSRGRAFSGLLINVATFATALLVADSSNCAAYICLLNAMSALQAGLFITFYAGKRVCYTSILTLLGLILIMYIWGLWV